MVQIDFMLSDRYRFRLYLFKYLWYEPFRETVKE